MPHPRSILDDWNACQPPSSESSWPYCLSCVERYGRLQSTYHSLGVLDWGNNEQRVGTEVVSQLLGVIGLLQSGLCLF